VADDRRRRAPDTVADETREPILTNLQEIA